MDDAPRQTTRRLGSAALGERLSGFVYGTLVAMALVIAGAKAYPDSPGRITAFVVLTAVVLWLAHVYAHGVGHSVSEGKRMSLAELGHIARREGAIVEAALPPIVPLLLAAVGLISTQAAIWAALALGLVVLGVQGVEFARIERLGWIGTLTSIAANVGFGLLLVALKLFLTH